MDNLTDPPVRTMDADIAFASERLTGNIGAALKVAGFHEVLSGEHTPPVSEYRFGEESAFFVEFLATQRGSGVKRDGTPDATIERAGVTAQKLRHLDLLILAPWTIRLTPVDIPLSSDADVQLPNPVSYMVQKLLIAPTRPPPIAHGWQRQFGSVTDTIRNAVRIPQNRILTAERFQARCEYGLEVIFKV